MVWLTVEEHGINQASVRVLHAARAASGTDVGAVGAQVSAAMPGSRSAAQAADVMAAIQRDLAALAQDLDGEASALRLAATDYAAAEAWARSLVHPTASWSPPDAGPTLEITAVPVGTPAASPVSTPRSTPACTPAR